MRIVNETEDLNLNIFNMITGINESRILTKHILCKCECKFDDKNVTWIKSGTVVTFGLIVKNITRMRKIIFWILLHVVAKMVNI